VIHQSNGKEETKPTSCLFCIYVRYYVDPQRGWVIYADDVITRVCRFEWFATFTCWQVDCRYEPVACTFRLLVKRNIILRSKFFGLSIVVQIKIPRSRDTLTRNYYTWQYASQEMILFLSNYARQNSKYFHKCSSWFLRSHFSADSKILGWNDIWSNPHRARYREMHNGTLDFSLSLSLSFSLFEIVSRYKIAETVLPQTSRRSVLMEFCAAVSAATVWLF